ncbi:hypothetical protein FE257_009070 [Aspergillus nanangensis]|uniref:Uncharacterized protein n=1 Tax=Aspergillus nanangensis TaxID=2582783 RepID=A0AAD4CX43_ASPNN|nr:hypothetical protein FE257_009070 [Aspergillus nanangensis]
MSLVSSSPSITPFYVASLSPGHGHSVGLGFQLHRSFSFSFALGTSGCFSIMACPITVGKFVGTVSLGLLTGLSYSSSSITLPSLKLLPTSVNASRALHEVKRLTRKHTLRLTNIANGCLLFSYGISPKHRQHPYLIWMVVASTFGSYGLDYWFHRENGITAWLRSLVQDIGYGQCTRRKTKKEDDLVVVEAEENINGESVEREMATERRFQRAKAVVSGLALAMGIVGLWGDKRP